MANKNKNKQNEVLHVLDHKGDFTAYLQIYGKNGKLLTTVFAQFTSEEKELTRKELIGIEEYLLNRACIKEEYIDHTVSDIRQDDLISGGKR